MHDTKYKSINLGEEVIKEMIKSSIFGVPVSAKAAMTAYRLMIKRVTLIAKPLIDFENMPYRVQKRLLYHNADMVVSLRGAHFFQMKKEGQVQILYSLGIDDLETVNTIIAEVKRTHNAQIQDYKTIEYRNFNTIQEINENAEGEKRYELLLSRVGEIFAFDEVLLTLLSYVLLFCSDFDDEVVDIKIRQSIQTAQQRLIVILQRYVYAMYPETKTDKVIKNVLNCLGDLRELCSIKQKRRSEPIRKVKFSYSSYNVNRESQLNNPSS